MDDMARAGDKSGRDKNRAGAVSSFLLRAGSPELFALDYFLRWHRIRNKKIVGRLAGLDRCRQPSGFQALMGRQFVVGC
jgi:hypothetical protein